MKKYLLLISFIGIVKISSSQNCLGQYGQYPTDFDGQKCWMKYYLKTNLWVYNNKNENRAIYYKPVQITEDTINSFFKYNDGKNNYYLDESHTAWGGYWFACKNGGIACRFNQKSDKFPTSTSLKWTEIEKLPESKLNMLSPAEKMDILLNDHNLSITKYELLHRGPERNLREDDGFCGFCNGARIAGAILPEPKHSVSINLTALNKTLIFTQADIKALASAAYMHPAFYFSLGLGDGPNYQTNDPNPALFDVMLRLYLAENHLPFVIDADYGPAIYNETVLGYNRTLQKRRLPDKNEQDKFTSAKEVIQISLQLYLQDELTPEQSNYNTVTIMADSAKALTTYSPVATPPNKFWVHKNNYKYNLFIDKDGYIIGGEWIGQPIDFMWAANGDGNDEKSQNQTKAPGNPNLNFQKILELVQKSVTE